MTVSLTTRFGLSRWSSDSDALTRTQIDQAHENLELYLAKMLYGTSVPSVGLSSYARTLLLNKTNNRIYYYTTDDEFGEWIYIETDVIPSTIAENKGDVIVATAPNTWGIKPVGTINQILTVFDNAKNVGWSTLLTAKGDLLTLEGGTLARIPAAEDYKVLHANSATTGGIGWSYVNTSSLADSSITALKISNGAVSTPKIVDRNIVTDKIAELSVIEQKIADSAVSSSVVADLSGTASKILDGSVTSDKIATGSVTTSKLSTGSVVTLKLGESSVTTSKFANNSVSTEKILDNAVSSAKIATAGVATVNIANNAVSEQKLQDATVITQNFNNLAVTFGKLVDLSVTGEKVAANAVTTTVLADGSVTTSKIAPGQVVTSKIADLSVENAKIAADAVTTSKIGQFAITSLKFVSNSVADINLRKSSANSVIGNSGNSVADPSDIVAANDNTALRRSGNFLSFGQVQTGGFADGAVSSTGILDGTLADRNFSDTPGIGLTKLKTGPMPLNVLVGTSNYIDASVTYPKLNTQKNSLGVAVWLDYTPTIYFTPVSDSGSYSYPGQVFPTTLYTLSHAKYMKINNLCLVNFAMKIKVQSDPIWNSVTSYNDVAGIFAVSAPFAPLSADGTVIGTSHVTTSSGLYDLNAPFSVRNVPITMQGLITFAGISEIFDLDNQILSGLTKTNPSTQTDLLVLFGKPLYPLMDSSIKGRELQFSVAYDVAV